MIIQKELHILSSRLQHQTGCIVHNISVDLEDQQLSLWVTLYDPNWDTSYVVSVTLEEYMLNQFSDERNIKEVLSLLVMEWADVAKDNVTIH